MCFCLWFMQYFSMKRNMAAASMNKQTETMQKAMLWLFPVMYIFSGVAMPFAVLVYWLTNNVCNLCRTLWQVYAFPTPGSPAAADKEKRDHRNENARRAKAGLPSLEEEALAKAKEEAERKATQGYQRQQPVRKRKKKCRLCRCEFDVSRETFNTHRHYFLCSGEQGLDLEFKHDMKE